jgi:O-antigen/teichoic acid export membrane protein
MTFRRRLAAGLAWTAAYQAFSLLLSLVSVVVTARIIPPEEFGLVGKALLFLTAINGLATTSVITHALFHGREDEPDWNLYLWLGLVAQSLSAAVCNLVAFGCWFVPEYRPLAPLLHVASIGMVLDAFVRLDAVMCQRELDIRRNQLLLASCDVLSLSTVIVLALLGHGVWGLLLGGNVVRGMPYVVHLFFIRGWRPDPSRWVSYSKSEVLAPVKFALHFSGANAGNALKQLAESALIPLAFTNAQVGFLSRAMGLYSQTAGRVVQGFNETATAALPSLSSEPDRFRRGATTYLKVMGGLIFAAVGFLAFGGPTLSAVLYGPKWKEVDPFILPAALQGSAMFFAGVCSTILLAAGRQRANIVLLVCISLGAIPSLVALAGKFPPQTYLWTQAVSSSIVALVGLLLCRPIVGIRKVAAELFPALLAAAAASAACFGVEVLLADQSKWLRLSADVLAFASILIAAMRTAFPVWLGDSLSLVPKGAVLRRWLRV